MLLPNYTGRCPAAEMALNDELIWLWKQSDALYPILALENLPEGTNGSWLFASNQIREALRVAALAGTTSELPVFPLVKSMYTSSSSFLSEVIIELEIHVSFFFLRIMGSYFLGVTVHILQRQSFQIGCMCVNIHCVHTVTAFTVYVCQANLVNTVGESAALGAAGVIIWDRFHTTKTQVFIHPLVQAMQSIHPRIHPPTDPPTHPSIHTGPPSMAIFMLKSSLCILV